MAQELTPIFEEQFSDSNLEEGYVYVVGMDLEKFFNTVNHRKLVEVLPSTIKDNRVISLIHKYLNANVARNGLFAFFGVIGI